jgi:diaminohydroxyphosphoribosylaminopyrimidine deaminase/5-amino-6-(5-phosphoribosylamino)uracil reductase
VVATRDPNPQVAGRGLRYLRSRGLEVSTGALRREAVHLNQRFLVGAGGERPFVMLKAALTLDGRIATRWGESRWITSPAQRRRARGLRRLHDGVAIGVGTALADDPLLLPTPEVRRPFHRVVFDSRLRLPPDGRLARTARRSPVWVLATRDVASRRRALEARGVRVVIGRARRGRISLGWALATLREEGIWSLMVEGGAELLGGFLAERRFDQVVLFRAPLLLGGQGGMSAFGGRDPRRLSEGAVLGHSSPASGLEGDPLIPPAPGVEVWYPRKL